VHGDVRALGKEAVALNLAPINDETGTTLSMRKPGGVENPDGRMLQTAVSGPCYMLRAVSTRSVERRSHIRIIATSPPIRPREGSLCHHHWGRSSGLQLSTLHQQDGVGALAAALRLAQAKVRPRPMAEQCGGGRGHRCTYALS
jgi:hypothetical protein